MKRSIFILGITLSFALRAMGDAIPQQKMEAANTKYFEARAQAQANYRKALADALAGADKIEVFLLDFEMAEAKDAESDIAWDIRLPASVFPIVPYRKQARILARKTLSPDEVKLLLGPLQAAVGVEKNTSGGMCHFPIHGLRAWSNGEILFQTSFCWHCANFYLKYPSFDADSIGLSGTALKDVMNRLMPIPQKEIDRFNAKYPSDEPKPTDQKPGK